MPELVQQCSYQISFKQRLPEAGSEPFIPKLVQGWSYRNKCPSLNRLAYQNISEMFTSELVQEQLRSLATLKSIVHRWHQSVSVNASLTINCSMKQNPLSKAAEVRKITTHVQTCPGMALLGWVLCELLIPLALRTSIKRIIYLTPCPWGWRPCQGDL